jgi:hypothetical protein
MSIPFFQSLQLKLIIIDRNPEDVADTHKIEIDLSKVIIKKMTLSARKIDDI